MAQDLALRAVLSAQDLASGVIKGFGSVLNGTASPMSVVTGGLLAIGVGAVAFGAASVKMAADYQQSMTMVQSLTGSSKAQMAQYDSGLKALAVNAGVAPTELAKGLYNVLSAGYTGADAMNVLTLATEDAKIGMTDSATTTNALTTVMKAFSVNTKDAGMVNGEMLATVTLGKMTMAQYAGAIGKASVTSKQYGVSMESMNASIATMTSNGIPSAAQAVTDYNQTLKVMYSNIGSVSASLHKNGIAFDESKFNAMSYSQKIQYMNQALQEAADKHVKITGVTIQAAQAIQVISQHSQEYAKDLSTLSNKQQMAQATQKAWALTQGGFNQTLDRISASLQVVMINIGTQLLPVLTQLGQSVLPLIQQFGDWITKSGALQGVGRALAGGIAFLASGIAHMATQGKPVISFFQALIGHFQAMARSMSGTVAPALSIGRQLFAGIAGIVGTVMQAVQTQLLPALQNLVGAIAPIVTGILHWIATSGVLPGIFTAIHVVIAVVVAVVSGLINVLAGLITFFSQNAIGIAIFKAVLITLGLAITAIAIVAIPILIGAFYAWLSAAIMTAIGNIIAFAPIIVPILAIIAVIALVVLAISHWGQIVSFFAGVWHAVWGAVSSFFVGVWNAIVAFFVGIWNDIVSFVKAHALLLLAVITGPIGAIVILIVSHWNQIMAFLQTAWEWVISTAKSLWAKVIGVFASAWSGISTTITNLWRNIAAFFGGLPGKMLQFGEQMITGLINGIKGMAGNLASAVTGLLKNIPGVGAVAGFLHIPGFAEGVTNFSGGVALVGEQGPELVQLPSGSNVIPLGNGNDSVTMQAGSATPTSGPAGGSTGNTYISVVVYAQNASASDVAKLVMQQLNSNYKRSGSHVVVTSGGRAN